MIGFIKKNWIKLLIIINVIIVGVAAAIIINHKNKSATINILVAPSDAIITLNGKEYKNGEYNVKPGEYYVEISKDGLEPKTLSFDIDKNGYHRIYEYLVGQNGSFNYYNPEGRAYDVSILEQIAEVEKDQNLNDYLYARKTQLGIISHLPIIFEEYTDNYNNYIKYSVEINRTAEDCPKILCLKITDINGANKQRALDSIKELGYNPDDYEIEYVSESL